MSQVLRTKHKNALRHGLYASEVVLPWESEAAFAELLNEFQAEYRPQGPTEEELVFDLVRLRWIKRRIVRSAQLKFREDVMATRIGQATKGKLEEILSYVEAQAAKGDELRAARKRIMAIIEKEVESLLKSTRNDKMTQAEIAALQDLNERRSKILRSTFAEVLTPLEKLIEGARNERDVVEAAYSADTLEKIIQLEAMVDTRFEKTLGRLLALQEFRRPARVKQIEHTSK